MIFKHVAGGSAITGRCHSSQFTHCAFSYDLFGKIAYKSKLGNTGFTMGTCFGEHFLRGELF